VANLATLDLIMSTFTGKTEPLPNLGSSDHISISFTCQVENELPDAPQATAVFNGHAAPWNHIRGAVKRSFMVWNDSDYESPDEAESNLRHLIQPIIDDYVPKSKPKKSGPTPWWNYHCGKSFKLKLKTFGNRTEHPHKYERACKICKKTPRKAFKAYNLKIKKKLSEMSTADRNFRLAIDQRTHWTFKQQVQLCS
jgi:hypothetical protein